MRSEPVIGLRMCVDSCENRAFVRDIRKNIFEMKLCPSVWTTWQDVLRLWFCNGCVRALQLTAGQVVAPNTEQRVPFLVLAH